MRNTNKIRRLNTKKKRRKYKKSQRFKKFICQTSRQINKWKRHLNNSLKNQMPSFNKKKSAFKSIIIRTHSFKK